MRNNRKFLKRYLISLIAILLILSPQFLFSGSVVYSALQDDTAPKSFTNESTKNSIESTEIPVESTENPIESTESPVEQNPLLPQVETTSTGLENMVLPTVTVSTPLSESTVTTPLIIKGSFTYGSILPENATFTAYKVPITPLSTPKIKLLGEWEVNNEQFSWSFKPNLTNGPYKIVIEIKDKTQPSLVANATLGFTLDLERPYISEIGVVIPYQEEEILVDVNDGTVKPKSKLIIGEDLTSIEVNATIRIRIVSKKPMENLKEQIIAKTYIEPPVSLQLSPKNTNDSQIPVTGTISVPFSGIINGKNVIDLFFTPDKETKLKSNSTYLAYIDPNLKDDEGNKIFAKFFKFTTKSNLPYDFTTGHDNDRKNNPHGRYAENTNMCANCHSTHTKSSLSLQGVSYQSVFSQELERDQSDNYCMACHDGTMNAPVIDKLNSTHQHNNPINKDSGAVDALKKTDSCTSCHNPHLDRTEKNPNLLNNRIVYTHKADSEGKQLVIDSMETACLNCHDDGNIYDLDKDGERDLFAKVLSYNKSFLSKGTLSDYALCLRCHNANKVTAKQVKTDIEYYYSAPDPNQKPNLTDSKHNFVASEGSIQADGSQLSGSIPCADCHETHGSKNIKMIRDELGNERIIDAPDKFQSVGLKWDAVNERNFCVKCHNGKTEIYGRVGQPLYDEEGISLNPENPGHNKSNEAACATCHTNSYDATRHEETLQKALMESAHAPKGVKSTP
ncbi:hypothetical protein AM500_02495 [Bacillus sp. FJAT-18017]|uniref:multiheme c-type cytochrome n=1 Tax=Bacillus sp. FJAT-18017 TaxID=1705566 RepID=UPI0006B06B56|nr:cytochrome c3 family protein [Bacillus sp. FJAT-18017]ALC88793.1 hypothetical protein AM500_02495 [Bacillus sp. FJAT-18017]